MKVSKGSYGTTTDNLKPCVFIAYKERINPFYVKQWEECIICKTTEERDRVYKEWKNKEKI